MDRFLLVKNPMVERVTFPLYIFHTQKPATLIQVYHESIIAGGKKEYITGNYMGEDGIIETITLGVKKVYENAEKERVQKVLNKAWHWYIAYLKKTAMKNIDLEDAHAMSVLHNKFNIPSENELKALKVGQFVKVCSEGERFWCKVEHIKEGYLIGKVDNDVIMDGLYLGDLIKIMPQNIYSIE